jgi:hypothetical protein
MQRKPLLWIAALALAAALGLSAQASAATVKGTVVHVNKKAHTLVLAGRKGRLTIVSSRRLARPGSVVRVSGRRLKNGTLRAHRLRVKAHRRHARIRGVATWQSAKAFTVSARRASLLVRKSESEDVPVGAPVESQVTIEDNGDLDDDDIQQVGAPPDQIKLEGVVLSTDPTAETITISGDDDQEEVEAEASHDGSDDGADDQDNDDDDDAMRPAIVVHVPDATQFMVGEKVELIVTGPAADGSFTLVSVDEDENEQGDNEGPNPGPGAGDEGDRQVDNSGPGSEDDNSGSGDGSGDSGDGGDG